MFVTLQVPLVSFIHTLKCNDITSFVVVNFATIEVKGRELETCQANILQCIIEVYQSK